MTKILIILAILASILAISTRQKKEYIGKTGKVEAGKVWIKDSQGNDVQGEIIGDKVYYKGVYQGQVITRGER
jgi:hypothetical protein